MNGRVWGGNNVGNEGEKWARFGAVNIANEKRLKL